MLPPEALLLQWSDFQKYVGSAFKSVRSSAAFSDITLLFEDGGEPLGAHKVVLASGSSYFHHLLSQGAGSHPHPLVVLGGLGRGEVEQVLDFLYLGEARVQQDTLTSFLAAAARLGVRGLQTQPAGTREQTTNLGGKREDTKDEGSGDADATEITTNYPNELETGKYKVKEEKLPEPAVEEEEEDKDKPKDISATPKPFSKRSPVWNFYSKVEESQSKAKCNICGKVFSTIGGSTSALLNHMLKGHNGSLETQILTENIEAKLLGKSPDQSLTSLPPANSLNYSSIDEQSGNINFFNGDSIFNDQVANAAESNDHLEKESLEVPVEHKTRKAKSPNSPVWMFMERLEGSTAKCIICGKILSCTNGTTSQLLSHILKHHPKEEEADILRAKIEQKKTKRLSRTQ